MRIWTGRAGSGKTTAILQEIAALCARGEGRQILLVPELNSHQMERRLAAATGNHGARTAEVLTFSRLADRVFSEVHAFLSLLHAQMVRAGCLAAPDLSAFYNQMIASSVYACDVKFSVLVQRKGFNDLSIYGYLGDQTGGGLETAENHPAGGQDQDKQEKEKIVSANFAFSFFGGLLCVCF